jgi:aquaporin Z
LSETSKTAVRLAADKKRFLAELVGTFVIVVFATGSVVIDARLGGVLGTPFAAICPAIAVALMVYAFGKISMAHFNPAVTLGFLITGHITPRQFPVYFAAEIIGALLASAFVAFAIGTEANLGANAPNYSFPLPLIIAAEVLATGLLMAVIYVAVYTRGLRGFGGIAIGGMIGLDILFLSFVSGASMNPARSLAPALLSGFITDLWLYWTATFAGAAVVATVVARKKKLLFR